MLEKASEVGEAVLRNDELGTIKGVTDGQAEP